MTNDELRALLAEAQAEAQKEREKAERKENAWLGCDLERNEFRERAEKAERRAAELERDARRYRWLAGNAPQHSSRWQRWKLEFWSGFHGGWQPLTDTELDAAIDTAIEREGGEDE